MTPAVVTGHNGAEVSVGVSLSHGAVWVVAQSVRASVLTDLTPEAARSLGCALILAAKEAQEKVA